MAKKQLNYSDLSTQELEILKDTYIDLKVKSMSNNDLKDFAYENISLQIKSTIGNDEELEAWHEMEDFFKDEFENTIKDIKINVKSKKGEKSDLNIDAIKTNKEDKRKEIKLDMWND